MQNDTYRYRKNERYQDSEHHYMYVALPMATSIYFCVVSHLTFIVHFVNILTLK